jgi:hypothetical protein
VEAGQVSEVYLPHVVDWERLADLKTLRMTISDPTGIQMKAAAELQNSFGVSQDMRGDSHRFRFDPPVQLQR